MKTIYKYNLNIGGQVTEIKDWIIEILNIQIQNGWPTLWAIVDTEKEEEKSIQIYCCGTGWPLPDKYGRYIGTAIDNNGYVWHYFINKKNFLNELWIPCTLETLPEKEGNYHVIDSRGLPAYYIFTNSDSSKEYWLRCVKAWKNN